MEGADDGTRWGSVDDSRGHDLDHVVGVTETVAVALGREQTTGTADVDITGNEGHANTALLGDSLEQLDELLLLLSVDVAGPGVDHVIEQLGSELAKNVLEGLALFFLMEKRRGERSVLNDDSRQLKNASMGLYTHFSENLAHNGRAGKRTTSGVQGVLEQGQGRVHNGGAQDHNDVASGGQHLLADLAVEESVGLVRQNGLARALRAGIRENHQGALSEMGDGVPALAGLGGEEPSLAGGLVGGVLLEEEVEARGGSSET